MVWLSIKIELDEDVLSFETIEDIKKDRNVSILKTNDKGIIILGLNLLPEDLSPKEIKNLNNNKIEKDSNQKTINHIQPKHCSKKEISSFHANTSKYSYYLYKFYCL